MLCAGGVSGVAACLHPMFLWCGCVPRVIVETLRPTASEIAVARLCAAFDGDSSWPLV